MKRHTTDLVEVRVDVLSTLSVQLSAADALGEAGDADDVGGLQVLHQEVAACLRHVLHLVPDTSCVCRLCVAGMRTMSLRQELQM